MSEHLLRNEHTHPVKRLALTLVDGHCVADPHRKLHPDHGPRIVIASVIERYSRDEHYLSLSMTDHYLAFQNFFVRLLDQHPCSINQTTLKISKEHDWTASFENEVVIWKPGWSATVEQFSLSRYTVLILNPVIAKIGLGLIGQLV